MENLSEYDQFERKVTDIIKEELECPNGDAQGIVEAQDFYLSQSWGKGLSVKEAAEIILMKSAGE